MADEVPKGSGADSKQGLWKVLWHNDRNQTSFRTVLVQMADEVPKGSSSDAMKFRMVRVQIADKDAEVSGAHSRQSSGGLRCKNLPRSSKLLGITYEFIFGVLSALSQLFSLGLAQNQGWRPQIHQRFQHKVGTGAEKLSRPGENRMSNRMSNEMI